MCGVVLAPSDLATAASVSASSLYLMPFSSANFLSFSGVVPLPDWIAKYATSLPEYLSYSAWNAFSSYRRFTNGQPGFSHSSTTNLPLRSARLTSLPSWSLRVKFGAASPMARPAAFSGAFFSAATAFSALAAFSAPAAFSSAAYDDAATPTARAAATVARISFFIAILLVARPRNVCGDVSVCVGSPSRFRCQRQRDLGQYAPANAGGVGVADHRGQRRRSRRLA